MNLTGREKATIFLSILGSETASRILRYLPEELADVIATSINHLPTPTPDALGEVMNEFKSALELTPAEPVRVIEEKTISKAQDYARSSRKPETPIEILNAASAKKLAYLFSFERPQLTAFLLSRLDLSRQEEILMNIGPSKDIISGLLKSLKTNKYTPQIEEQLIQMFGNRLAR